MNCWHALQLFFLYPNQDTHKRSGELFYTIQSINSTNITAYVYNSVIFATSYAKPTRILYAWQVYEKFEDTKWVIRTRNWTNRQYNSQKTKEQTTLSCYFNCHMQQEDLRWMGLEYFSLQRANNNLQGELLFPRPQTIF